MATEGFASQLESVALHAKETPRRPPTGRCHPNPAASRPGSSEQCVAVIYSFCTAYIQLRRKRSSGGARTLAAIQATESYEL